MAVKTIAKAKKRKKYKSHGKKRKVGSMSTISGHKKKKGKKRRKSHHKGLGMIPQNGLMKYVMQVGLSAAGYIGAGMIRNVLFPKWFVKADGTSMLPPPADLFIVTGIGLGAMYLDRRGQNELYYIGLGMAGYGIGEFVVEKVPGLSGIGDDDLKKLKSRIMGKLQQQARHQEEISGVEIGRNRNVLSGVRIGAGQVVVAGLGDDFNRGGRNMELN
jgi:hypothetical protein